MALSIRNWSFVPLEFFLHPFCSFGNNSWVHTLLLKIYLSTVQWKARNWSVISYSCSLSFMMSTARPSVIHVIHVGTAPAFTHFCRCCFSLGSSTSFSSFAVMITFSFLVFLFYLLQTLRTSIVLHWFRP